MSLGNTSKKFSFFLERMFTSITRKTSDHQTCPYVMFQSYLCQEGNFQFAKGAVPGQVGTPDLCLSRHRRYLRSK